MKQREYDKAFNVLGNTLCQDPENPKALLTIAAEMQVSYTNLKQINYQYSFIFNKLYR